MRASLNRDALRQALDRIVARHEALRTSFALVDGEPEQRIAAVDESRFHLLEEDLREHEDAAGELQRVMAEESGKEFDLEAGPLIRGRLIQLAEQEHALLISMHHIVSDGWSMGVLINELSVLYGAFVSGEGDPLPELGVQYADYAAWQRKWMEGEVLRRAGRVLEEESGRSAGDAGVAGGSMRVRRSRIMPERSAGGIGGGIDGEVERTERAAGDDAVYDATGGLGSVAGSVVGSAGFGDRYAGGESRTGRDRRA